jgi:hypothetical protein
MCSFIGTNPKSGETGCSRLVSEWNFVSYRHSKKLCETNDSSQKGKKKKGINIISGGPRGALVIIEIKQGGETYSD